jgi:hypothetical protein
MYDRSIVDRARRLSASGMIDREVAEACGVSLTAVAHWRRGERRNLDHYRERRCPRCDGRPLDEIAYAYLLGLYLGDGHLTEAHRGVFALSIKCCDDWPGLRGAAEGSMKAVMPTSSVCRVQRVGCTEVKSYSKHWPCLFPQHGPGRKHHRKIELAPWQQKIVAVHPGEFARGLFHSDGCRSINRVRRAFASGDRWYSYPRYFFSNESRDILGICGQTLDRLGVAWRFSRPNAISVARREAVARLDEFVGPKY